MAKKVNLKKLSKKQLRKRIKRLKRELQYRAMYEW